MVLDQASALTNAGSLLSPNGEIVASYDLEVTDTPALGYRALGRIHGIHNAALHPFDQHYSAHSRVHVINGMGVTLGDSIIGLTALYAIARRHPQLRFVIYRPAHSPQYVNRLYELAAPLFGSVVDLPVRLDSLPEHDLKVDIGNHLFWPNFSTLPMIDFFLEAMGMRAADIPADEKRNHWLKELILPAPAWGETDYVLMCPIASTPVRSIAPSARAGIADQLWKRFGLPVAGFGTLDHPRYTDVSRLSPDTADFLSWIRHARYVVTSDTAAVHIAAGFDVATTAFFTTIAAPLRARDYEHCKAITLAVPGLEGLQSSNRLLDIETIDRAYRALADKEYLF
jgi:hypothetical protein